MTTKHNAAALMGICLCALSACRAPSRNPTFSALPNVLGSRDVSAELMTMHKDRFRNLAPARMYLDRGNLVVVQKEAEGVESGKYIIPFISSYDPTLGGDGRFTLSTVKGFSKFIDLGSEGGMQATVYEYQKSQLSDAANGNQPIRSETNQTSSAAGSRR